MENKALTIEQMRELIDMGIDVSKASIYWSVNKVNARGRKSDLMPPFLTFHKNNQVVGLASFEYIPTFTLQDILDMLPKYIKVGEYEYKWNIMPLLDQYVFQYLDIYDRIGSALITFTEDDVMVGAYNLLKWCKENNFI